MPWSLHKVQWLYLICILVYCLQFIITFADMFSFSNCLLTFTLNQIRCKWGKTHLPTINPTAKFSNLAKKWSISTEEIERVLILKILRPPLTVVFKLLSLLFCCVPHKNNFICRNTKYCLLWTLNNNIPLALYCLHSQLSAWNSLLGKKIILIL